MFQVIETLGISHEESRGSFLDLLFETTSAFGTVGLTTGVTPSLGPLSRMLTILLMFCGRVGPLTLGLAILARRRKQLDFEYAEEDMMVG